MTFSYSATTGDANITVHGGVVPNASGSQVNFLTDSTAGSATFFAEGGQAEGARGSTILFSTTNVGSAKNANFTVSGGTLGAFGGQLIFDQEAAVGDATCIMNGGIDGGPAGYLALWAHSTGGTARVELFGNGTLDVSSHDRPGITIGSLEGDGIVLLQCHLHLQL
jgi:hypothetical protein